MQVVLYDGHKVVATAAAGSTNSSRIIGEVIVASGRLCSAAWLFRQYITNCFFASTSRCELQIPILEMWANAQ